MHAGGTESGGCLGDLLAGRPESWGDNVGTGGFAMSG